MKTLEDWKDAYYEQQARFTESNGMLTDERDRWIQRAQRAERELEALKAAGVAIYMAGHWTCDRPVDDAALWTALRDALGLPPGNSPKPLNAPEGEGFGK